MGGCGCKWSYQSNAGEVKKMDDVKHKDLTREAGKMTLCEYLTETEDVIGQLQERIQQAEYLIQDLDDGYLSMLCVKFREGDRLDGAATAESGCDKAHLMCNLLSEVLSLANGLTVSFLHTTQLVKAEQSANGSE